MWAIEGCGRVTLNKQKNLTTTQEKEGFWGGYEQAIQRDNLRPECIRCACGALLKGLLRL